MSKGHIPLCRTCVGKRGDHPVIVRKPLKARDISEEKWYYVLETTRILLAHCSIFEKENKLAKKSVSIEIK